MAPKRRNLPTKNHKPTARMLEPVVLGLDLGTTATRASLVSYDPKNKPDIVLRPNKLAQGQGDSGDFPSAASFFALDKSPELCIGYVGDDSDQTPIKMFTYIARIMAMRVEGEKQGGKLKEEYQVHEKNFRAKIPQLQRFFQRFDKLPKEEQKKVMTHARKVVLAHLEQVRLHGELRARAQGWEVTKVAATIPPNWDRWTQKFYVRLLRKTWKLSDDKDAIVLLHESEAIGHWLLSVDRIARFEKPTRLILADFGGHTLSYNIFEISYRGHGKEQFAFMTLTYDNCHHGGSELHTSFVRERVQEVIEQGVISARDKQTLITSCMDEYRHKRRRKIDGSPFAIRAFTNETDTDATRIAFSAEQASKLYDECFAQPLARLYSVFQETAYLSKDTVVVLNGGTFSNTHILKQTIEKIAESGFRYLNWTGTLSIDNRKTSTVAVGAAIAMIRAGSVKEFMAQAVFALKNENRNQKHIPIIWDKGKSVPAKISVHEKHDTGPMVTCCPMPPDTRAGTVPAEQTFEFQLLPKLKKGNYTISMEHKEKNATQDDRLVLTFKCDGPNKTAVEKTVEWPVFYDPGSCVIFLDRDQVEGAPDDGLVPKLFIHEEQGMESHKRWAKKQFDYSTVHWEGLDFPSLPLDTLDLFELDDTVKTGNAVPIEILDDESASAPSLQAQDRAMNLTTLGSRLHMRFERTASSTDLGEAIEVERRAATIMSPDDPERANTLINLAAWLGMRFQRTGLEVDLYEAVHFARAALDLIPENHDARSSADQNLNVLLSMQYDHFGPTMNNELAAEPNATGDPVKSSDTHDASPVSAKSSDPNARQTQRHESLDFESSPALSKIQQVIGTSSLTVGGKQFEGRCRVFWNFLQFCERELEPDSSLHTVVTLTGAPTCAETNTCEEFARKIWGSTALIDFLSSFARDCVKTQDPFMLCENTYITLDEENPDEKQGPLPYTSFSISGPLPEVAGLFQQLAWLTAVFTLPTRDVLTASTATLTVLDSRLVEIRPKDVAFVGLEQDKGAGNKSSVCWHRLLRGTTLAYGFPISQRDEGMGLEIPFDLMVGLADVRTQIDVDEGATLLGGTGIVLYPTRILKDGVQWHCAGVDDDDYVLGSAAATEMLQDYDIHDLLSRRTFLGYYSQAEVLLGTMELVSSCADRRSKTEFPRAPPRIEFANEGTFASGFTVKGIFTLNFAAKYQLSKTLRVSLQGRGYHDMVDEAERQATIIYDGETRCAWLVSELSVVLHLALSYLSNTRIQDRRQTGCRILEGTWPLLPYAEPCSDGGGEAQRICKRPENCRLELWTEGTKVKTFADVVEDILRDFRALKDGAVVQRRATTLWPQKTGLRGWEYTDLVTRSSQVLQKEVPRDGDHEASWWELGNANDTLVILGRGFGSVIRPKPRSRNPIEPWNIPPGSRLLIASKPCMNALTTSVRGGHSIGSLEWRAVQRRPSSCNEFCNERSCYCIQILRKETSSVFQADFTEPPKRKVLEAQAVIFGESKHFHSALEVQWMKRRGVIRN